MREVRIVRSSDSPLETWLSVRGHSQKKLSVESRVPESSISFFRSRQRRLGTNALLALARVTGTEPEALFAWMVSGPRGRRPTKTPPLRTKAPTP